MKVSIIIPAYNREKFLKDTLESFLLQKTTFDFEVIVCDNNSKDKTRDVVHGLIPVYPNLTYVFEARQGVHYARNTAAESAQGDLYYFTDDDMIAEKGLLQTLVDFLDRNTEVGCATGLILPIFLSTPPAWVTKYMWNAWLSLTDRSFDYRELVSTSDFGVYSCHQLIKKELFLKSGGFNPENTAGKWIGNGETGLNIKLKNAGCVFGYTSKSIIYHQIPAGRLTRDYFKGRLLNQARCDVATYYQLNPIGPSKGNYLLRFYAMWSRSIVTDFFRRTLDLLENRIDFRMFMIFPLYHVTRLKELTNFVMERNND